MDPRRLALAYMSAYLDVFYNVSRMAPVVSAGSCLQVITLLTADGFVTLPSWSDSEVRMSRA